MHFRQVRTRGYKGGETRLTLVVCGLVAPATPEPSVRFEMAPGKQMQADWASVGRGSDKLNAFITMGSAADMAALALAKLVRQNGGMV